MCCALGQVGQGTVGVWGWASALLIAVVCEVASLWSLVLGA